MTTRTADGGRAAVRRAHRVFLALCAALAALAVVAHHETTAIPTAIPTALPVAHSHAMTVHTAPSVPAGHLGHPGHPQPTGHLGRPGDGGSPAGPRTAATPTTPAAAATPTAAVIPVAPDGSGSDADGCATAGAQHCASAGVAAAPFLALPGEHGLVPPADPARAAAGRTPAGTADRAPPDLSVLSRMRI
jgi:Family of unknown function (DUF6153)